MTERPTEQPETQAASESDKSVRKMTPRRAAWAVFLAAIVLAVICAAALPGGSSGIVLPEGSGADAHDVITEQTQYQLTSADITKQNVQQVVASLARPEVYSASVTNTLYWNGAWKEIHVMQYVRDGVCLTEYDDADGNAERFEAVKDGSYFAWQRGNSAQYTGSTGTVTSDDLSMIPTYETLVEEDPQEITEAGLRTVGGVSCIYATVADAETGYNLTYWISSVSGLLIQADYTRGSELVRSVVVDEIEQEQPSASLFVMPDGTSLLPEDTE